MASMLQNMGPLMNQLMGGQGNSNQTLRQMAQDAGADLGEEDQSILLKLMEELSL